MRIDIEFWLFIVTKTDSVSFFIETDMRHEMADQEDSTAAGSPQGFFMTGVSNPMIGKSISLIFDFESDRIPLDFVRDCNLLSRISLIPMLVGIDQGFIQRQADCKA